MSEWQYNGVAPWSDIVLWCGKNFGYEYYEVGSGTGWRWKAHWETIYFINDKDYVFFLLRWS